MTGIAASALGATIVSSSNSAVSNSNQAKDIHFELFSQPNGGRLLAVLLAGIVLWAVLQLIVGGAVQLGYAHFNLNLVDGNDAAISDLFSQKDRLWDGFCMKFLQGLYIALWSLLLVIPGIVKTYSYKIDRINKEIAKTREKITEYQNKLKGLEVQKTEAENLEIVQLVRAMRLTPQELNAMLSGGGIPGMTAAPAEENEQEENADEE